MPDREKKQVADLNLFDGEKVGFKGKKTACFGDFPVISVDWFGQSLCNH